MNLFRTDNTEGYSQHNLDVLNAEWDDRVREMGLEEHTDEYDFQAKRLSDEVSRRQSLRGG